MEKNVISNGDTELLDLIKRMQLLRLFGIDSTNEGYEQILNREAKLEDLYARLVFLDECGSNMRVQPEEVMSIMSMGKAKFAEEYGSLTENLFDRLSIQQRIWLANSFQTPAQGRVDFRDITYKLTDEEFTKMISRVLAYAYPYEKDTDNIASKKHVDTLSAVYYQRVMEEYPDGIPVTDGKSFDKGTIEKIEKLFNTDEGRNIPGDIEDLLREGDELNKKLLGDISRVEEVLREHVELANDIGHLSVTRIGAIKAIVGLSSFIERGDGDSSKVSLKNPIENDEYRRQADIFLDKLGELLDSDAGITYDGNVIQYKARVNKPNGLTKDNYFPFRVNGYVVLEPIGEYGNATYILNEEKYEEYLKREKFPCKKDLVKDGGIPVYHENTQILDKLRECLIENPEEMDKAQGARLYDFTAPHFYDIIEHVATLSDGGITRKSIQRALKDKAIQRAKETTGQSGQGEDGQVVTDENTITDHSFEDR